MSNEPKFWFPVKRYGWGWGAPVRWQGWAALGVYVALACGGIYYFDTRRAALAFFAYLLALTVVFVAIVALKGEKPVGWRSGKSESSEGRDPK
jgi:hypothetical protein